MIVERETNLEARRQAVIAVYCTSVHVVLDKMDSSTVIVRKLVDLTTKHEHMSYILYNKRDLFTFRLIVLFLFFFSCISSFDNRYFKFPSNFVSWIR